MAEQPIEYEDRTSELEGLPREKKEKNEDDVLMSLHKQHKAREVAG